MTTTLLPGTRLKQIIPRWVRVLMFRGTGCDGCDEMMTRMDVWGVEGCIEHRDEIIEHLYEQSNHVWIVCWLAGSSRRAKAEEWFEHAIGNVSGLEVVVSQDPCTQPANLTVVTSLSPRRTERHRVCIQTWLDIGLDVVAYQSANEIESLQPLFPSVEFRPTEDAISGLVTLRAIAQAGVDRPILIANSDLELYGSQDSFVDRWSGGDDLRIGFRWNYDRLSNCKTERHGIDVIRITPAMVPLIDDDLSRLGYPGWDWWIPAWLDKCGFSVTAVNSPEWFHQRHKQTWTTQASGVEQVRLNDKYDLTSEKMLEIATRDRFIGTCRVLK